MIPSWDQPLPEAGYAKGVATDGSVGRPNKMPPRIPGRKVLLYCKKYGYRLKRRKAYPGEDGDWFYLLSHREWPWLGFPVTSDQVSKAHFTEIKNRIKQYEQEEEC